MITLQKTPSTFHKVTSLPRAEAPARYITNDTPETVHAVAEVSLKRGKPVTTGQNEWQYTEFDEAGGLRHLTEPEALHIAASLNQSLGWEAGNAQGVITYSPTEL